MTKLKDKVIHIGCQAWGYDDWVSRPGEAIFYPQGAKDADKLSLYSEIFDLIELDSGVYGIPSLSNIESWYKNTPEGFFFAPKVPRKITHENPLGTGTKKVFDEFCERVRAFRDKLAPALVLFPPQFEPDAANIENFRGFVTGIPSDLRFAIEFRNQAWLNDSILELMKSRNIALCLPEGRWISRGDIFRAAAQSMPDFAYLRFMGPRDLTSFDRVHRNMDANLSEWAAVIERLPAREVFILFSNFYEGHAPASANKLKKLLGLPVIDPAILERQGSLF
jgi:uncharacterized protein YecE (DUF72 family)